MTQTKFKKIEAELNRAFLERGDEIHGLILAALSGKNIFFVGPPGTAKTQMVRAFCGCVESSEFFYWLLTRFSTPEEMFGPVDLGALKSGSFKMITAGKMPEANVAFLDEVFKGNSAILNSLLSILQERIYHNDGAPMECPLIFAAGASNELPEADESLEALYDRFLLRYNVKKLREQGNFDAMLAGGGRVVNAPTITQDELEKAREAIDQLPLDKDLLEALWQLRDNLEKGGFGVSDRRFVQALEVLRAEAWFRGHNVVTTECMDILAHVMWDRVEDMNQVQGLCYKVVLAGVKRLVLVHAVEHIH